MLLENSHKKKFTNILPHLAQQQRLGSCKNLEKYMGWLAVIPLFGIFLLKLSQSVRELEAGWSVVLHTRKYLSFQPFLLTTGVSCKTVFKHVKSSRIISASCATLVSPRNKDYIHTSLVINSLVGFFSFSQNAMLENTYNTHMKLDKLDKLDQQGPEKE